MWFPELARIENASVRNACRVVIDGLLDEGKWSDVDAAPFIPEFTEPEFRGTHHVRTVTNVALQIAKIVERDLGLSVDRDLLIAACLLHDASKWVEYVPDEVAGSAVGPVGEVLPHPVLAAVRAYDAGLPLEVVHAIFAHSPQTSAEPQTLVAVLVQRADEVVTACSRLKKRALDARS